MLTSDGGAAKRFRYSMQEGNTVKSVRSRVDIGCLALAHKHFNIRGTADNIGI